MVGSRRSGYVIVEEAAGTGKRYVHRNKFAEPNNPWRNTHMNLHPVPDCILVYGTAEAAYQAAKMWIKTGYSVSRSGEFVQVGNHLIYIAFRIPVGLTPCRAYIEWWEE